jgi:2-aminoadipate transaminase
MLVELERAMPRGTRWTPGWRDVRVGDAAGRAGCQPAAARAIERQVALVPGADFHANGGGHNTMRLNFSHPSPDLIQLGIRRLAEAIGESASADESAR